MLIDELKVLASKSDAIGCIVNIWLQEQDKDFQEVFASLRGKPNLNMSETLKLIKKYHPDIPFKQTSFNYHMRGVCTCPTA
jgi:hypothetical protein